jgi:hypothetical protein
MRFYFQKKIFGFAGKAISKKTIVPFEKARSS